MKPLKNRVIATKPKQETKTKSGILLGETKDPTVYAIVESVGPEVKDIKKSDKILYKEYSATTIKIDNQEYLILEDKDILATL